MTLGANIKPIQCAFQNPACFNLSPGDNAQIRETVAHSGRLGLSAKVTIEKKIEKRLSASKRQGRLKFICALLDGVN